MISGLPFLADPERTGYSRLLETAKFPLCIRTGIASGERDSAVQMNRALLAPAVYLQFEKATGTCSQCQSFVQSAISDAWIDYSSTARYLAQTSSIAGTLCAEWSRTSENFGFKSDSRSTFEESPHRPISGLLHALLKDK